MQQGFMSIMSASVEDRKDLFMTAANNLGTTLINVEKDFWVCWTLDLLFNQRAAGEPRLLFKGGTSLSKGYGIISRFSEDIDITVFREDLNYDLNLEDLGKLSRKKQRAYLEAIRSACQTYIKFQLANELESNINKFLTNEQLKNNISITLDPNDRDEQTLLIHYPSVSQDINNSYIKPSVKVEAGAKSAITPHSLIPVTPYIAPHVPALNLRIENVTTIHAERTFWDKIIILHSLRSWFDNKGEVRHQGNRISRHYYDIYKLFHSDIAEHTISDYKMANACTSHTELFFNRAAHNLDQAKPGTFNLTPTTQMLNLLKKDYTSMSDMIFGDIPTFEDIIDVINKLELQLNKT